MCRTYFNKYRFMLIMYLLIIIVSGICTFILPIISSGFIDYLSNSKDVRLLIKYCICFTGVSTIGIVIGYIANRVYLTEKQMTGTGLGKNTGKLKINRKDYSRCCVAVEKQRCFTAIFMCCDPCLTVQI